jgi:hypothetical protein
MMIPNLAVVAGTHIAMDACTRYSRTDVALRCSSPIYIAHNVDEAEDWGLEMWLDVAALASS